MFSKTFHRSLLDNLLEWHAPALSGAILDIGSKNRRYDSLLHGTITAADINADLEHNILYADLNEALPFPDGAFSGALCIEVLEYVHDLSHAFGELHRVLKPGGMLIASIPFLYHDHDDWARYTNHALRDATKKFSSVTYIHFGNGWTVISDIILKKSLNCQNTFLRSSGLAFVGLYNTAVRAAKLDQVRDRFYSGVFLLCHK